MAWAVGRYGGHAFVRRWGRYVGVHEHDIDRATVWFDRHGPAAVFFGRMIPVVRTFISLPAGFGNMAPVRFGVYTALGCIPWTTGLAVAGYYLGSNWQSVANGFHGPTYIIAAVVLVAVLAALVVYFRRRRGTGARAAAASRPVRAKAAPVSTSRRQTGNVARRTAAACPARSDDHP